jgi:hypothetical protein
MRFKADIGERSTACSACRSPHSRKFGFLGLLVPACFDPQWPNLNLAVACFDFVLPTADLRQGN